MCAPAASWRTGTRRMPCASSAASSGSISGDGSPKTKRTPSLARQRASSSPPFTSGMSASPSSSLLRWASLVPGVCVARSPNGLLVCAPPDARGVPHRARDIAEASLPAGFQESGCVAHDRTTGGTTDAIIGNGTSRDHRSWHDLEGRRGIRGPGEPPGRPCSPRPSHGARHRCHRRSVPLPARAMLTALPPARATETSASWNVDDARRHSSHVWRGGLLHFAMAASQSPRERSS